MFTIRTLLAAFETAGKLQFEGKHYGTGEPVYTGDLWRLWHSDDGLESKRQGRLLEAAEKAGIQVRFYDELTRDDNGEVHESNPGYYGAVPTFQVLGDSVWSEREAEENPAAYLEALAEAEEHDGRPRAVIWDWLDLEAAGWTRFDYDAESGFHAGQNDTPETVRARVQAEHGADVPVLFRIDSTGQFDVSFSAYFQKPDAGEAEQAA